jgi:uncharacterized protein (TIGR03382 family)
MNGNGGPVNVVTGRGHTGQGYPGGVIDGGCSAAGGFAPVALVAMAMLRRRRKRGQATFPSR